MTIYKEKNMKKETLLEFERIFELINHKKNNKKINIKKTLEKINSNILKEQEEFEFDFEEFKGEKEISDEGLVKSGRDDNGKYYANELYSTPAKSSQPFDMAFRMSLVGVSPEDIEKKIKEYNQTNPNEPITTYNPANPGNAIFGRTQREKLGLLGLPGNLTEINKYSLEFLSRVYSEKLNAAEQKFDEVTGAFSSDSAKKFAGILLDSWLRTAVKTQFIASAKVTFNEIGEIATFTESFEGSIKKIMELLKTKYDPTKSNFNAFAVTVMKNDFKNNLKKITTMKIPDYRDLEQIVDNFKFPYIVKTNKNYRKKLEAAIKKDVQDFNKKNWDSLKKHSNTRFSKAGLLKGDIYVGFQYLKPEDLISDLLQSNEKNLGGKNISFSPVYLENIFDDRLKSVFKAVIAKEKRELPRGEEQKGEYPESTYAEDAILRAVGLENIDQESIPDTPYDYETEQSSKDFFGSQNFLKKINEFGKEKLPVREYKKISAFLNPLFTEKENRKKKLLNKYPELKKMYLKILGEILYQIFVEKEKKQIDSIIELLKNKFINDFYSNLKAEEKEDAEKDKSEIENIFKFSEDSIKGFSVLADLISQSDDETKKEIVSQIISEQKRKKAINKILLESKKTILKESFFQDVQNTALTLSQNTLFKNKYNNLSDSEKSKLLEKLVSAFIGKTSTFSTFNLNLPINNLFLDILTYVITKKGIANSEIKDNCKKIIMLILYNNVGLLKKITQIGFQKAKIKYSEEIYNLRGQDIILDAINEKLDTIKDSDSFDPNKSAGKTWLFNIIANKVSDLAISISKIMSGARSIDAPTTKSSKASDDTDDDFDSGVVSDDDNLEYDVTVEPDFDFKISDKIKKVLQNISSQKGFNIENFIKNKYKDQGDFTYSKGDKKIGLAKGNKNLSIKDAMMLLLLFIIGDGSEELYSKEGFHKTSKFIDYLVKNRGHKIVDLNTGEELPLDDLSDNDPESIRPNRSVLSRIVSDLQSGLKKKEEEMKAKGAIYENIRKFVEKYYIIKESKKKAIELEEERIANPDGQPKVDALENFIGSQVFGEDIGKIGQETGWEDGMYGVFSYGKQFPIYLYTNEQFEDQDGNVRNKDGKYRWFHNIEEYKYDIDKDGEKEIMSSVEKHKEVLKPSAPTHGLTTATLVSLVNKFMRKNGIKDLSHISINPGGGSGVHFGDSDHLHDGRKDRKNKR